MIRLHLVPWMVTRLGVAPAPPTRFLLGQRALLLRSLGVDAVLDVGGNVGQYGQELRRAGFRGGIWSFEPGAEAFSRLSEATSRDKRWRAFNIALSDSSGHQVLHNWSGEGSTVASLHVPTPELVRLMGNPKSEMVQTIALAEWLRLNPDVEPGTTLLKADVQGAELEVLRGAGARLAEFAALEIEASLSGWYEREADLAEVLRYLTVAGFVPVSVMTERFTREWLGAVDVDVLAIRRDLSRLPA